MLSRIEQLGSSRGLQLLSTAYTNDTSRYVWLCKNKHRCSATIQQVQSGFRCKKCRNLISEEKVRFIFNELTGENFIKTRKALNGRLELDGYCEKLHMAFEYNGSQHYQHHPVWHKNANNTLCLQQERDHKKERLCQLKHINKLDVKYDMIANLVDLISLIKEFLLKHGISIKQNIVDWRSFDYLPDDFNVLRKCAEKRNGELMTPCFLGSHSKHKFKCGTCSHEWCAIAKDVLQKKSWCPNCANNQKKDMSYLSKLADELDMTLVSKLYHGMSEKYEFACKRCQSMVVTSANNIQQKKRMCSVCSKNKPISAKKFSDYIRRKGIKLLDQFLGLSVVYSYQCLKCNNIWKGKASNIWNNRGCPQCAISNKRLSINNLHDLGQQMDLELLSHKYLGRFHTHMWKCMICKRVLSIKPVNVRRGTSCRMCKKNAN